MSRFLVLLAGATLWLLAPASARAELPSVMGFGAHASGPSIELVSAEIDPAGERTEYSVTYEPASSAFCSATPGDVAGPPSLELRLPSPGGGSSSDDAWGPQSSTKPQALAFEDHQYHPVSVELPGLAPAGAYCAQLVASNHSGRTPTGKLPFAAGAPSVIGSHFAPASDQLQAEVDAAGQLSSYQVLYAPSTSEWCTSGSARGAPAKLGALTPLAFDDGSYHAVSVQLTGLVAGVSYCAALYAENGSGSALGSQVTFTQPAQEAGGPGSPGGGTEGGNGGGAGPMLGQSAQVGVTSGTVTTRPPGATSFAPFEGGTISDGTEIDATHGVVVVTVRTPDGKTVSATVFGGRFRIHQDKDGETHFILTLPLTGCSPVELPRGAAAARVNGRLGKRPTSRYLWVAEKGGRWGTNGRFVSTSVEGTRWLTLDECKRSVVRVREGRVKVRNLVTRRTKTLRAGGRYVAHAAPPRHKRHH